MGALIPPLPLLHEDGQSNERSPSTLQPARQLAGGGEVNHGGGGNRGKLADLRKRLSHRFGIQIQDTDRFAPRCCPAHGHLSDIHAVPTKDRPHAADDTRHVAVTEHQQISVQICLQAKIIEGHQSRHLLTEDGPRRPVLRVIRRHFGRHR
jgi:hypothetical protein